ncbi:hypothetical protein DFA_04780 [Cavenderia fasciculata]|uniref:SMP-30/Gluconolactonase/LRE-like region domain-containing protein n=1 Tax=Cavenderia fasciculata TaxID=261658 RepID=F4PQI7_CACFS|nr:uncharacterized protein DFA_04780 [Cavenderia fasciculata]EGG22650.1 hypothetical protein DFA_04780 [Cavenderia fasciculata]|eukprot:XP_004360501.1 hypothetical protein DFA_04780 [Cavenderia fasciculata]
MKNNYFYTFTLVLASLLLSLLTCTVAQANNTFGGGNLLLTDTLTANPEVLYEFTAKGVNVNNYTTWVQDNSTIRCVANDIAFLDDSTLLLLDEQQGLFYSSMKGNVKGIYNNMTTNQPGQLGCSLQRLFVDQTNQDIYITSTNVNCDLNYVVGVFVYDVNGKYKNTILNNKFNTTLGVAVDSKGTVWIPDVDVIFAIHKDGSVDEYDPVKNKLAYNGIQVTTSNTMLIAVPATHQDLIIELDTKGRVLREIVMVGNTTATGQESAIPCTIAINPSNGDIFVEAPYASKKEGSKKEENVIQVYDKKGNYKRSWGGHSCKDKNILCVPQYGMVFIPEQSL